MSIIQKWIQLDSLAKVLIAAAFFIGAGSAAERLFSQQRTMLPRVESLETWRVAHTLEYQQKNADIQNLMRGQEYMVCVLSSQRVGKTEQDCYENHILRRAP